MENVHYFGAFRQRQHCHVAVHLDTRKRPGLDASLYQILQILSLTLFEKTPILQALQLSGCDTELSDSGNQLILFGF